MSMGLSAGATGPDGKVSPGALPTLAMPRDSGWRLGDFCARNMKLAAACTGALLALAATLPAQAQVSIFTATLAGSNEVPAVVSAGAGSATVTLTLGALPTLRVQASFSDLLGTTTAAHIRCCTPTPDTANAGVATTTPTFLGFPLGVFAGSHDQTLDLLAASSYNPAFVTANGGTVRPT